MRLSATPLGAERREGLKTLPYWELSLIEIVWSTATFEALSAQREEKTGHFVRPQRFVTGVRERF
jgi:hypothetical protein